MRLKRKSRQSSATVALSHQEVFVLVQERKIHLAEELYTLAQTFSQGGDSALLNYCTGEQGQKKNLQRTIDSVWALDSGAASAQELDARHRNKLSEQALLELQRRAQRPKPKESNRAVLEVLDHCTGGLGTIADAGIRRRGTQSRISRFSAATQDSAMLFDHFDRQAEIVFRPRGGLWRLRDFFELLVACRHQPTMAQARPGRGLDGGIQLPRTEVGWQAMLKAGVAEPAAPFATLSAAERASSAAELRFGSCCGAMTWRPSAEASSMDDWITSMPKDPSFERDTFDDRPFEEKLVRLWAKGHVEDKQLAAVLGALEACQHVIYQTKGFFIKDNSMRVTATKARASKHRQGPVESMTWAHATLEEEKEGQQRLRQGKAPRLFMLGSGRAGGRRPEMNKAQIANVRALCDKPKAADDEGRIADESSGA